MSNVVPGELSFSQACDFSQPQGQQPVTGRAGHRRIKIAPGGLPPEQKQLQMANVGGTSAVHTKNVTSAVDRLCINPMTSKSSVSELEECDAIGGAPTAAYLLYSDPSFVADGPGQSCSIGIFTLTTFMPSGRGLEYQGFQSKCILPRNCSGEEVEGNGVPVKQRTLLFAKGHAREAEAAASSEATGGEAMRTESWQSVCKKELARVLEDARLEKISHVIFTEQLTELHDSQSQADIYKSVIRDVLSDQRIKMQEGDGIGDSSSGFVKVLWVEPVINMDARESAVSKNMIIHYLDPQYDFAHQRKRKAMCGFFSPNGKWPVLSNFWSAAPLTIDGLQWQSVEHYFQACKFHCESPKWKKVRSAKKPASARQVARAAVQNSSADLRFSSEEWDAIKDRFMLKALRAKVESCPEFCETLEGSKNRYLFEDSPYDKYWGVGSRRTGENRLGRLLMQVRSEYYAGLLNNSGAMSAE